MSDRCGARATSPSDVVAHAATMRRVVILLAALVLAPSGWGQGTAWQVEGEVAYEAQDGLSTWSATAPLAAVELVFAPAEPTGMRLLATVHPADFDSGVALRDLNARRTVFDVARHPDASAVAIVDPGRPVPDWRGDRLALPAVVDLTLHGVTRRYPLTVDLRRDAEGFAAEARFEVSLEAHGMPRPRLLAWLTEDAVQVSVTLRAHPLPAPTPTTR